MKNTLILFVLLFSSSVFAESVADRLDKIEERLDKIEKFLGVPNSSQSEDILTDSKRLELILSYLELNEPGFDPDDQNCTKKIYMNSSKQEKNSIYAFFWVLQIGTEKTLHDDEYEKLFNEYGLSVSDAMKINEKFSECF